MPDDEAHERSSPAGRSWGAALTGTFVPALIGNIIGGVTLVAVRAGAVYIVVSSRTSARAGEFQVVVHAQ